ncbi:hypothetical protein ACQR1W_19585 [Bradyrhizobium sp. HKCCYLS1011]|uniref:hypothetical protein n=1 Tax=Bradyrhizobium sp. HKCCYLS1011 TaxID=3420733 RepID=UPI00267951EE
MFHLAFRIVELFLEFVPRLFSDAMQNKGFDDPAYTKNVQELIARNKRFEEVQE